MEKFRRLTTKEKKNTRESIKNLMLLILTLEIGSQVLIYRKKIENS